MQVKAYIVFCTLAFSFKKSQVKAIIKYQPDRTQTLWLKRLASSSLAPGTPFVLIPVRRR
jgi:hypothetical protein